MTVINSLPASRSFILQETANHKLVEGLAEASRARKQSNLRLAFNQFFYHQSFIDEISVFLDYFLKILHTDGYFFRFSCLFIDRSSFLSPRIHTFPAPPETGHADFAPRSCRRYL